MPEFDRRNIVHFAIVIQEGMRAYLREHPHAVQSEVELAGVSAGMQFSRGTANPAELMMLAQREQSVYPPGTMLRCI